MKKGFTLIELLAVIVILAVISVIAYPKILDIIESSKIRAFDSSKKLIIESAETKYLADVNSSNITEYKVLDLIDDGYIKKGAKNPLTGKEYEDSTKILITNDSGNINFYYIEGSTILDKIKDLKEDSGIYKQDNEYIYKGINAKNYLSFNGEIYRIIKIDNMGYIYIVKNDCDNIIEKAKLQSNLITMYNDEYDESIKKMILNSEGLLTYDIYNQSILDGDTYIYNGNDIWIYKDNDFKILTSITDELTDSKDDDKACARIVLKLKNYLIVENGDGSQFNPYKVNIKNY